MSHTTAHSDTHTQNTRRSPASHHEKGLSHFLESVDFGEGVDAAIGATAIALTGEQLAKAAETKTHRTTHLLKAGLGAAVALAALKMFKRDHDENRRSQHHHGHPAGTRALPESHEGRRYQPGQSYERRHTFETQRRVSTSDSEDGYASDRKSSQPRRHRSHSPHRENTPHRRMS